MRANAKAPKCSMPSPERGITEPDITKRGGLGVRTRSRLTLERTPRTCRKPRKPGMEKLKQTHRTEFSEILAK